MVESANSSLSLHSGDSYHPRSLRQSTDTDLPKVCTTQSHVSELSRFMSSVRNDLEMDEIEYDGYKNQRAAESILLDEVQDPEDEGDEKIDDDDGPPVDRGMAWVMAICSMLMVFATWGANAGFGVFLSYYLSLDQFAGSSKYDFALIGGIVVFLAQSLAPFSGLACRVFGTTPVFILGIIIQTAAYICASFATKLWHLYLAQGVFVGISFVMVFIPATFILPPWFDKRMATAMGITVGGAGLGGVVFSLSINKLIDTTGDQRWALRMCGIVTGSAATFAALILRPRKRINTPLKATLTKEFILANAKIMFNFKIFRRYPLAILALWFLVILMNYIILLFSLAPYAQLVGLSASQGSNITAILNAAQVVGRPIMGYFGDSIGRNNTSGLVSLTCSILILAFWINAKTYASLIGFSVLIGFIVGVGSTMAQSMAADLVEIPAHLPAAWSGLNILVGFFSLVAEVIALKLVNLSLKRQYLHPQIFTGVCFFFGFLLMMVNREWLVRRKLQTRRHALEEMSETDELEKEKDINQVQLGTYNRLLTPQHYFTRMFYPIRV